MQMTLYDAGILAFLFRNDIHLLHHNVTGIDFKDTHEFLGALYDRALDDFDYFMEHSILTKEIEEAPNMSTVLKNTTESVADLWHPIKSQLFSVEEAFTELKEKWKDYSEVLDAVRDYCNKKALDNICSDIDQIKSDWSIEIDYKVMRTLS